MASFDHFTNFTNDGNNYNIQTRHQEHRTVRHGRDNYNGGNFYYSSQSNSDNWRGGYSHNQQHNGSTAGYIDFQPALNRPPRFQRHQQQNKQQQPDFQAEYCSDKLEHCKDATCMKRHPESEFKLVYKQNQMLSLKMKYNIGKSLFQIDKDIKQARLALIEAKSSSDEANKSLVAVLEIKVLELIQQRHAFCSRAFESLWLKHFNRYAFVSVVWRDLYRLNGRLPALAKRLELENAIRCNDFVMVVGATGSGKSTQLPQYVIDMPEFNGKKVYCTQPRRVATMHLAERVALEFAGGYEPHGQLGRSVGFQIGGLSNRSSYTIIEYMTEGMLVQHLADKFSRAEDAGDPNSHGRIRLNECAAVIVDEVHERNIISDFLLGLLKAKKKEYPKLKVIVASATVDNKKFSDYLACPVIDIPGKTFPVKVDYQPHPFHSQFPSSKELLVSALVTKALEIVGTTWQGHILVFITGQFEAETARDMMQSRLLSLPGKAQTTVVHALYGKQTPEEQYYVLHPPDQQQRMVIFATDVAETSLTVDGVRYVIDCGYSKDVVYDCKRNVTTLKVFPISKSSADQRAGRAGRTMPGFCYRIYSKSFYDDMDDYPKPEIQRRSLSLTVTALIAIGQNPYDFEWIDAPEKSAIKAAEKELRFLGIIKGPIDKATVTDVGRAISSLQIEPSLGRMIYYACKEGFGRVATALAGLMTCGFPLFSTAVNAKKSKYLCEKGEIISSYRAYVDWLKLKEQDDFEAKMVAELEKMKATEVEESSQEQEQAKVELAAATSTDGRDSGVYSKTPVADEAIPDLEGEHETADEVKSEEEVTEIKYHSGDEGDDGGEDNKFDMFLPDEIDELAKAMPGINETKNDSMPASPRIAEWALKNAVSSDACYMAFLEQKSLISRLQIRGIWKATSNQDREPSDEDLQKMALNALVMNVAKLEMPLKWRYRVLTTQTTGEVFKLCLPRSIAGFAAAPKWVVFHEATQPAANSDDDDRPAYLHKVTPIEPSWIIDGAASKKFPKKIQQLVDDNMTSSEDESSDDTYDSDAYLYYDSDF